MLLVLRRFAVGERPAPGRNCRRGAGDFLCLVWSIIWRPASSSAAPLRCRLLRPELGDRRVFWASTGRRERQRQPAGLAFCRCRTLVCALSAGVETTPFRRMEFHRTAFPMGCLRRCGSCGKPIARSTSAISAIAAARFAAGVSTHDIRFRLRRVEPALGEVAIQELVEAEIVARLDLPLSLKRLRAQTLE